jgi:hypothetical protein
LLTGEVRDAAGSDTVDAPSAAADLPSDADFQECCDVTTSWKLIGGSPVSGPAVARWGPGENLDVFWQGATLISSTSGSPTATFGRGNKISAEP